ncbi:MAG: anthranilate phosphoribosyltransferase, partial [Blastocatellia bacterium]|nr:anthranilate phosphoribosyltransferase [Blastocatellia bacterium]
TSLPTNCDARESASIIRAIFANDRRDDATEMIVLMNAAAAIYVSGSAASLADAYEVAKASVRKGMALEKLKSLSGPQN